MDKREMVKAFAAYETIAFGIPNLNFGGHDRATASRLVREGKGLWALCQGGVLTFVPIDYKLQEFEHFLIETSMQFEIIE